MATNSHSRVQTLVTAISVCIATLAALAGCVAVDSPIERESVLSTGLLADAFGGVRTIAIWHTSRLDPDESPEAVKLREAIDLSLRQHFELYGYAWLDEPPAQRVLEVAAFVALDVSDTELERMVQISPGYPGSARADRGMIAISATWPGRQAPVWRGAIEGFTELDRSLETRTEDIEGAIERLLRELPPGPLPPKAPEQVPLPES